LRLAEAVELAVAAALLLRAAWLGYREWAAWLAHYDEWKGGRRVAAFNAGTVVEGLDWTFEPFVHTSGTIREPNDEQISRYLKDVKAIGEEIRQKIPDAPDGGDPASLMAALEDLDLDSVAELTGRMAGIIAALCSGEPSRDTILALPPRRRAMFYGWLQAEVMSPEAAPGGGNAQVRTLRPAAAG
jgi:hypothetical protein